LNRKKQNRTGGWGKRIQRERERLNKYGIVTDGKKKQGGFFSKQLKL